MEALETSTVVTLINGTFARDATWVDRDGPLASYLRGHIPGSPKVEALRWSGGNSSAARHEGAVELSRHMTSVAETHPNARHFLIAHSHGGNVALQALRVSSASVDGLVCLNTPFLHCKPRSFTLLSMLGLYALMPVVIPVLVIGAYMYLTRYRHMYPGQHLWPMLRAIVWGLPWVPIGVLLVKPYERMVDALEAHFAKVGALAKERLVPDEAPTKPLFALTVPGDEAYWWLRLIDVVSLAVRLPLYVAIASLAIALVANELQDVVHVISWFAESLRGAGYTVAAYSFALALVSLGLYVAALLVMLAVLPLIRGHVLSYGEGIWESVMFHTTVKPYAVGMPKASVKRLPVWAWLRHSTLYSKQNVAQIIVEWIAVQSKKGPGSAGAPDR